MPVPRKSSTEAIEPDHLQSGGIAPTTSPVVEEDATLTPNDATGATEATGATDAFSEQNTDTTEAPKRRRGRQPGAPPAPPFDQQMFFVVRAQARKLASQQQAAGLAVEVDPAKLLEAVKGYPGFDGVDRGRLVSKYKQGIKQINDSPKGQEINSQGLEHPLYLPPLADNRTRIDFLAME